MPALVRDQEIELVIDRLAYGGRGVARHGELVVFVARALPGDRVRARVTKFKRRYAEARAIELLEPGPGRVEPRCAHFGICGGCAWQDLDYSEQVRHKHAQVVDAIERLGGFEGVVPEPMVAARDLYGYRNKVEYSWSATPDGPALGYHQLGRWDRLIAVEHCHIASDAGNDVRRAFVEWARATDLQAYDQRSGAGFLRHLVVREGGGTGELMAVLVTAPGDIPDVERLAGLLPPALVGVVHAVNSGVAEISTGLEQSTLLGRDWFAERIGGLEFRVSAGAFMQTNTVMAERLYAIAIEFAELGPDDIVWDLYCGAGAIGLLAARRAAAVYGIEISAESIAGARHNAERNGIANAEFLAGDVAMSVRPLLERAPRPDVAFVDPPRSGLTPKAVRRVLELAPQRLVYVSCNPTTFAPNARQLVDGGYTLERVVPLDMFPHTPHIECVALLRRASA
ncbi:MAG TPA: 23S rRNA (uracil(1939)-C(5))-methyltransferase RlmD [Gaiellales bacterium]|jgi:23S rRNA (uracil1939-C5)-methyltransferase